MVLASIAATAGCLQSALVVCDDGRVCPEGEVCDNARATCVLPDQIAACDGMPDLSSCSTPEIPDGVCTGGACIPAGCGNGVVEPGELCDDGNRNSGDGCSSDCQSLEICGDGVIDATIGEQCDDGNVTAHDGCSSVCTIEDMSWRRFAGYSPSPRERAAIAYDPLRRVSVVFGGETTAIGSELADTWEWNGLGWTETTPQASPPARAGAAITYDPDRRRVVLFGGESFAFGQLGDTWEYDGTTWTRKRTPIGPSPRNQPHMVWDPDHHRVVLFGGYEGITGLADTWTWDGASWTLLATASAPEGRGDFGMAYDIADHRVVVAGGYTTDGGGMTTADAWGFDGTSWAPIALDGGPLGFDNVGLVYDPVRSVVVAWVQDGVFQATWELAGATWTQIAVHPPFVMPMEGSTFAYDIERDEVLEWAGNPFGVVNNLYAFPRGAGPSAQWKVLAPASSPPAVTASALAYDVDRARTVMFGGSTYSPEVFEWDGTSWTDVGAGAGASGTPPPRAGDAMAWDGINHRVIVFGGHDASAALVPNDTWEWDGATWTMTSGNAGPPARDQAAMAYDSARGRVVLFGGGALTDTWEWDGAAWHDVSPTTISLPAIAKPRMAYDSIRKRTVLFDGAYGTTSLPQTWEWDGTTWTEAMPDQTPDRDFGAVLVYDADRRRVVLIGGVSQSASEWEWDGTTWRQPTFAGLAPLGLSDMAAAYDAARSQIVMFGGNAETWLGAYDSPDEEVCGSGVDLDGDGRIGCADEDCAAACARCGDGTCDAAEDARLCPADCTTEPAVCGDAYCAPAESCTADCP